MSYADSAKAMFPHRDLEKVRLTKKFAELIDGIDLSGAKAGDEIELSSRQARILIAEGWAAPASADKAIAADKEPGRRSRQLRRPKTDR